MKKVVKCVQRVVKQSVEIDGQIQKTLVINAVCGFGKCSARRSPVFVCTYLKLVCLRQNHMWRSRKQQFSLIFRLCLLMSQLMRGIVETCVDIFRDQFFFTTEQQQIINLVNNMFDAEKVIQSICRNINKSECFENIVNR